MKKVLLVTSISALLATSIFADNVVGSVNGIPIYQSEAENAIKVLSGGKTTYGQLKPEEKKQLVNILAPSKLVEKAAKNELSEKEKTAAISAMWMQKKMAGVGATDSEAQAIYDKIKASSKDQSKVPTFDKVKESIKMQIRQNKVIKSLMSGAKIVAK
ncbi:MAG: hypothetical protein PHE73_07220 [Sulfurovaceae bacterium]|nr:hypothetical protein [Sulfurovaceae bacterium]